MTDAQNQELIALYERWAKTMVHLTVRRLHHTELAKELVQETFVLACCKADEMFARGGNPQAWLFRTLEYLTIQERKKSYFSKEFHVEDVAEYLPFAHRNTGDSLGLVEMLPRELSEEDRSILLWRLEDRLTYEEIAKRCKISPGACRQRYSRAVQHCREFLEKNQMGCHKTDR